MPDIFGSGIPAGETLSDEAVKAICDAQRVMDDTAVQVRQMRETTERLLGRVVTLLEQLVDLGEQGLVESQELRTAGRALKDEIELDRTSRGPGGPR